MPANFYARILQGIYLLCAVAALSSQNVAAQNSGPQAMSGMATRSVSKYLSLERALLETIAARDKQAAGKLLDPEFEMRSAASQEPVSGADWLDAAFKNSQTGRRIHDLSVFETDGVNIVSFNLETKVLKSKKTRRNFIVDVWKKSEDRLLVRYMDTPVPLISAMEKPDGRE